MSSMIRVAAPPRVTFDYLAEPRNRPQWQSSLRAVDMLTDGATRVGTRWADRTTVGAAPRLEITEMTPPSVEGSTEGIWTEVGRWRGLTARLTLRFLPVVGDPGATDVAFELDIDGGGVWKVPSVVLGPLAPPAIRSDLRRAARIIEAGSPA